MNKTIFLGRTTKDFTNDDIKQTKDGKPYLFFTLAVSKYNKEAQPHFMPCVINNEKLIQTFVNYVGKGKRIITEGSLSYSTEKHNDTYINKTLINVFKIDIIDWKEKVEVEESKEESSFEEIAF